MFVVFQIRKSLAMETSVNQICFYRKANYSTRIKMVPDSDISCFAPSTRLQIIQKFQISINKIVASGTTEDKL